MKIVNRDVEFGNLCQRISSENNLCVLNNEEEKMITSAFDKLREGGKEIYTIEDLSVANEMVKSEKLAKARVLKKENSSGFILISSLTCIGTVIVGAIIFMTIKYLILG